MACVALKPGASCDVEELTRLAESRLGSFKSPKRIFIMEELPKGPSGKIQRLKLPEIVADRMVEI
jgi:long-chain acyl-CoA synthetase